MEASSSKSGLVVANERRPSGGIRIENPFTLKVGQVFTGFGIGCGVGIGVGRPINLGAIPVLNQVMGATRGATDALSGVSRHVNNSLRKLGAKNIEAGIGCGVGIGHGFGVAGAWFFMHCDSWERPNTKDLVATVAPLQNKSDVPSYAMLGIPKHEEAPPTPQHPLSAMGDACSRMDLTAIHQILLMTHYKDDEGTNELSFQEWNQQMKDMLEAQKRGDLAFRDKDLRSAMDCHSQAGLALGELRKENNFLRILWPVTNPPSSQEHLLHPQLLQKPLCPFLARRYFDDVGV
ncbi:putative serine/threonine-protein kinase [Prunus yedoensis var. nudiflora]|uniref:Putative serine/threonine-protein kinase n=1 Tax=Prunus yedoensis var. nudiflora TaxID=2094558 RepID=A0A314YW51_PRUYE|nr:putative serine/threonine-protein kinase [Prunus yedoensis var. nudiflora]